MTPKAWKIEKHNDHYEIYDGSVLIADVMGGHDSADGRGKEYARLIAQTPAFVDELYLNIAWLGLVHQALREAGYVKESTLMMGTKARQWKSLAILAKIEGRESCKR